MISFKKLKEKNILHDTLHIGVSDELLLLGYVSKAQAAKVVTDLSN